MSFVNNIRPIVKYKNNIFDKYNNIYLDYLEKLNNNTFMMDYL